jgi:hypothetical protein
MRHFKKLQATFCNLVSATLIYFLPICCAMSDDYTDSDRSSFFKMLVIHQFMVHILKLLICTISMAPEILSQLSSTLLCSIIIMRQKII